MQYFFILGKNQALSLAELTSIFGANNLEFTNNVALLKSDREWNASEVISRLGGTIKLGVIKEKGDTNNKKQIEDKVIDIILSRGEEASGKFKFGFSQYHKKPILDTKKTGMEAKKVLKERGVSSRMVTSREKTLSSVVVEQNKLTEKGVEIILIKRENEVLIGETRAVQPFKELSGRDYGRPQRDDRSGMLPPKLAQIMINLGRSGGEAEPKTILDPFCGSGTVLTEAALMGYKNLIGSDNSDKAIQDSRENLEWIKDKYNLNGIEYRLENTEAGELSKTFKKESVDMIITEPYLGPQRGRIKAEKVIKELEELYSKALKQFLRVLKEGGRVVMIWPVFRDGTKPMDPDTAGFKVIPALPDELKQNKGLNLTRRNTIIYSREGQRVWREIVILEK